MIGTRAPAGVSQQHQLDQVLIRRGRGGLNQEDITGTHVCLNLDL
jgi:hypothetical protein